MTWERTVWLPLVLALCGCSLHHVDREPTPQVTAPPGWTVATTPGEVSERPWWLALGDAKLDAVMRQGLAGSPSLKASMARLAQANAVARQAGAARLPAIGLDATATSHQGGAFFVSEQAQAGATISWEADLFNRLGTRSLSRRMEANARAEDVRAARLALTSRIADTYYGAVEQQRQLALIRTQIDVNSQLLRVTQARFDAGIVSALDVLQQKSELAATQSLIPQAEAQLRERENELDVLLGAIPDGVNRTSAEDSFADVKVLPPSGIPSELLLRRPDLRALRDELVAADAQIATAMAERLPRITLSGSAYYAASGRFTGLATTLFGSLVSPLLEWGARKAEVERNKALYTERLADFTDAYLTAIGEVENALYAEKQIDQLLDKLEEQKKILDDTVARAQELYQQGLTDYLPVLNAIRDQQRVERELLTRRREWVAIRIQLNRALGAATETKEES